MNESFSVNYENNQDNFEGINNNILSFNDSENLVKENYLKNENKEGAKELAIKQLNENKNLKNKLEKQSLKDTKEELDKEAMINEAKIMLYEKLGIDDNQNNNSSFENFEKGIVDELVLNNYDLAIQVWETNGKIILDGLSALASWEGLKQMVEAIGESLWSLFSGNAYEKGKSIAELGLIGTGVGAGLYVGKKTVKLGMKQISNLRVNKENLVKSPDIKEVVGETNNKLNDILPKKEKELDFEELLKERGINNKESINGDIKIIDRQKLVEDLPRKDIELKKITEFPELNDKQLIQIEKELNNVIGNIKYNSFEKIEKLFQLYKDKKGEGYSIVEAYNEIDFDHIDIQKGSNCVGMAYVLKDKLSDLGIKSHLIRFDAGGLINNDYVVNGHSALIIPSRINGDKHFTLADPGLLIPKIFTFADGKVSKPFTFNNTTYVMHAEVKDGLPYMLEINSKKKLSFDPYNEWLNPGETLNKDIMRAIGDFKVVKQNPTGKPDAFVTNLQKEEIKLIIGKDNYKMPYNEFLKIKNNKELYELFSGVIKNLGEKPDDFFNINKEIIEGIGEYKDKIWAPSTKKIIELEK